MDILKIFVISHTLNDMKHVVAHVTRY